MADADRRWRRDVALQYGNAMMAALMRAQVELMKLATASNERYAQMLIEYTTLWSEAGQALMHAAIPLSKSTTDLAFEWWYSMGAARQAITDAKDERGRSKAVVGIVWTTVRHTGAAYVQRTLVSRRNRRNPDSPR